MSDVARGQRGAVAIWLVGLAIYLLAVFHRSSLAVAGLAASERFGISAAQLSTFAVLQLLVYAGMQVPVGLILDRFGSRRVMLVGLATLTLAQAGFALAETYTLALVARAFVGVGDAMTFVCVLRLVNTWFVSRRIPLVTQLTGVLGQFGAILAAVPMTWSLRELGWTRSYLLAAAAGVVMMVALVVVIRDSPERRSLSGPTLSWATVQSSLADAWEHPGTRLGFWTHFTTQFSATTLALLWGFPYFVQGEGRSDAAAGALLTLLVIAVMVAGPVLAWAITNHPWHRSTLVIGIVLSIVLGWTAVLAWPGAAPTWLLVVLMVLVGIGGPASMIGFDFGRTFNPAHRLGTAIGLINQGGFLASLVLVLAIGIVLDWRTPGASTDYSPSAFVWAMSCQYVLWTLGLVQLVRYRAKARVRLRADDPDAWARMSGLG
ncbi:MAG: MFS transporter [Aeromicrobium sp.]